MFNKIGMSVPECEITTEAEYYRQILNSMVIDGDFSHGFTWSLGGKGRAREIRLCDNRQLPLSPSDLAVISIGLSFGDDLGSPLGRITNTAVRKQLGIINEDDCMDLFQSMMSRVRGEHLTNNFFINIAENQGKIIPLIRSYESLKAKKQNSTLSSMEKILWGNIISILSYKYEMRLYMIDPDFSHTSSWVDALDYLFDNFSDVNFYGFLKEGYENMWKSFLLIRDDIAVKKGLPTLSNGYYELATQEYNSLLIRMRMGAKIHNKLTTLTSPTQPPPSA